MLQIWLEMEKLTRATYRLVKCPPTASQSHCSSPPYWSNGLHCEWSELDSEIASEMASVSSEMVVGIILAMELDMAWHQQNVNWTGSHAQSCQTLWATSPVLLYTSRCSQTPLELSKVLWDCARAFSSAPESTWSYGGAFRMLRDLTYRIVKFWSSWNPCTALQETWCRILKAVVLQ